MQLIAPSPPKYTPPETRLPARDDAATQAEAEAAAKKQRLAARNQRGRAATFLTGGSGVTGAANTARREVLGV